MQCANNLKQIELSAHDFAEASRTLPPGPSLAPSEASALVFLLGYSDDLPLYNTFNLSVGVHQQPSNATARSVNLAVYNCPSDTSSGYWANPSPQDGVMGRWKLFWKPRYVRLGVRPTSARSANLQDWWVSSPTDRRLGLRTFWMALAIPRCLPRSNGAPNPGHDQFDVTLVPVFEWGMGSPATNPTLSISTHSSVPGPGHDLQFYRPTV